MWLWISMLFSVNALNTNIIGRRGVFGGVLFLNNRLEHKAPLCVNCKFFKNNFYTESKFGKCTKFPHNEIDYTLVDGISVNKKQEYYYCSTARNSESMCGTEGKFYQDKQM
jgi:hypothetical protein